MRIQKLTPAPPAVMYVRQRCAWCEKTTDHGRRRCSCGSRRLEPFVDSSMVPTDSITSRILERIAYQLARVRGALIIRFILSCLHFPSPLDGREAGDTGTPASRSLQLSGNERRPA